MKIILIGNYEPDNQESMFRFTEMLSDGFNKEGIQNEIWNPVVVFGTLFGSTTSGFAKWIGYIDKWILFPLFLKWRLTKKKYKSEDIRFHICDHSNSPYLSSLPNDKTAITCHDVLAIRGSLGYADAYCPASRMGKILQKWILNNLIKSNSLASVSEFTLSQLKQLAGDKLSLKNKNWDVIHNAFNAPFKPLKEEEYTPLLNKLNTNLNGPFLLHVGSSLPRKNRSLLLDMLDNLGNKWNGYICYAGEKLDEDLINHAKKLDIYDRIISIIKPEHKELMALFSACEAFIFPSFSEGFGWPLIEAQACGTVVIASNLNPMPEVSGGSALHASPNSPKDFANAFIKLQEHKVRDNFIQEGFVNIERFSNHKMIKGYLSLHGF